LLDEARCGFARDDDRPIVIRQSRRAKRLILKLIPPYDLELVVPQGTRPKAIEAFIVDSRAWIGRARAELRRRYPAARQTLPERIELAAVGGVWTVDRIGSEGFGHHIGADSKRSSLRIDTNDPEDARERLRRWLLRQGKQHLPPWLAQEAARLGVKPSAVRIRTQRTRWGSCSSRGNISLNAALLFLDPNLVRYLLVHELCHLRHLNHSKRYWRLVERFEPHYRELDAGLAASWPLVPVWALPR
jgi:hypothetical protein